MYNRGDSSIHLSKPYFKPIRVLIVDDQRFICLMVRKILESRSNFKCVGVVNETTTEAIIKEIENKAPDVVILDWLMPGVDTIASIQTISNSTIKTKILVYTSNQQPGLVQQALDAGANGYLVKGGREEELIEGIISACRGKSKICPKLSNKSNSNYSDKFIISDRDKKIWTQNASFVESLPKISLRILLWVLLFSMGLLLPWLALSKFEQIASVSGKLEPSIKPITLDTLVSGKVGSVEVKPGQKINANQVIASIGSHLNSVELQEQKDKLSSLQNNLESKKLLKFQQEKSIETTETAAAAIQAQSEEKINQARAVLKTKKLQLARTKIESNAAQEKLGRYERVYEEGAIPFETVTDAREAAATRKQNTAIALADIAEAESLLNENIEALSASISEQKIIENQARQQIQRLNQEISTLYADKAQTQNSLKSLIYQKTQYKVRSPINGIVFDLKVEKPGSFVEQGETIASIAPAKTPVVFRGLVETADSGFLVPGLKAKIKLDSFPWKEFGTVTGIISWISPTSFRTQDDRDVYELEIQIEKKSISNSDMKLIYGQTGTAEVVVRKRNILDLLFSS